MGKLALEIPAGTKIDDACKEAQDLANRAERNVVFDFNGVTCVAQPGGSAEALAERQVDEQHRRRVVYSNLPEE